MIIKVCAFTEEGRALSQKIEKICAGDIVDICQKGECDEYVRAAFDIKCPLIFIGACGIAVRKIAPYVNDKLTDPPVIVIDEKGGYVISLLSGHVGGANKLATLIADRLDAQAVITTATDVENRFSVDVFAMENHLGIANRDGIKKVSSKVLKGESLEIWDKSGKPDKNIDIIISESREYDKMALLSLYPRRYYLGIGCKKGTPCGLIEEAAENVLKHAGIGYEDIALVSSIDIKSKEYGLNEFAHRHNLRLETFSAGELMELKGNFESSEFVKETTGADNVCERAAMAAAGAESSLTVKKTALNGVTAALAVKNEDISRIADRLIMNIKTGESST